MPPRRWPLLCLSLLLLTALSLAPARAQSLIRDADIEHALSEIARPILSAAGLSPSRVKVLIINDDSLNAFVIDGRAIFVHAGLLLKMSRAAELQAVLSHEAAHIANGHITRRLSNLRSTQTAAGFGMALAMAAAAAGGGSAAAGLGLGAISAAQRAFFAHTRAEEASADQSGLRYMASVGADPQAMVDVLEIFRGQEALSAGRQDPYVRTHPLTRDRLRAVEGFAAAYGGNARPDPEADYWFRRARGKLAAFTQNPGYTLRRLDRNDTSDIAVMMRAVALHRTPKPAEARRLIDALVNARPNDAFYHDLRGQILLESRDFGGAVQAYQRAVSLQPNHPQILAGYGRALLALDTADGNRRALAALEQSYARDARDPRMLRDLAVAYAKAGQNGMASLATAERYAMLGRLKDAGVHARRAAGLLPRGSAAWQRADDLVHAAETAEN